MQNYPRLEVIVLDGGSKDQTVEILEKYSSSITFWKSEKDHGQTHAINEGFKRATGEFVGWQNSDDLYCENVFHTFVLEMLKQPDQQVYYGDMDVVDGLRKHLFAKKIEKPSSESMMPWPCIANQSLFFRKDVFLKYGFLDETYHHYMDMEYFWRLLLNKVSFHYTAGFKGEFRLHENGKSRKQMNLASQEAHRIFSFAYDSSETQALAKNKLKAAIWVETDNCFQNGNGESYRKLYIQNMKRFGFEFKLFSGAVKFLMTYLRRS